MTNDIKETLKKWCKSNNNIFGDRNLFESRLSITRDQKSERNKVSFWENIAPESNLPENFVHPGSDFYKTPPLIIQRNYIFPKPQSNSLYEPDKSLFTFSELPEGTKIPDLDYCVAHSPPLNSIFPDYKLQPFDSRIDVSPFDTSSIEYLYFKFIGFKPDRLIEPIFINVFLWDMNKKVKITETWRFFLEYPNISAHIRDLFNPIYRGSTTEMNIPLPDDKSNICVIVYLDRLLMHDNGVSLMKYYEKPSSKSNLNSARNDVESCKHPYTSITFAWTGKTYQDLISSEEPIIRFTNFAPTQSVNDHFLSSSISHITTKVKESKKSEKGFEVWFDFSNHVKEQVPKLHQFFDLTTLPFLKFTNYLVIQPLSARFKFPKGQKGRTIYAEYRIYPKLDYGNSIQETPLQVFINGTQSVYVSRAQYHVDKPYFNEDIYVSLPTDLPTTAVLKVDFYHAALKGDPKKKPKQYCGTAIYQLANSTGDYIPDGEHKIGISYNEGIIEKAEMSDQNLFTFKTILRSSLYPSNKTIASIFAGNIDPNQFDLNEENIEFLNPHLYSVLDVLISKINTGDYNTFLMLIKILSLYQCDRNSEHSRLLVYYLNNCALRHDEEKTFHTNFIPFYLKYLEETPFDPKRSDFYTVWFILELIIKSLLIDSIIQKDITSIAQIALKLSEYLPSYDDQCQTIGTIISRSLSLFYKDLFEILPNSMDALRMVSTHLKFFNKEPNKFIRGCFREFVQQFITPKIFIFLLVPKENSTYFNDMLIPLIQSGMKYYAHTNELFKSLINVLFQFTPTEYKLIAQQLKRLVFLIGKNKDLITQYETKEYQLYLFIIAHFILYYTEFDDFSDQLGDLCTLLIKEATHLTNQQLTFIKKKKSQGVTENLTKIMTRVITEKASSEEPTTRSFSRLKTSSITQMMKPDVPIEESKYVHIYDSLGFGIQSIMFKIYFKHACVKSLNAIPSNLLDVPFSPYLANLFNLVLSQIVDEFKKYFFDSSTNIKHIFRRIFQYIDKEKLELIEKCYVQERNITGNSILTEALVARSLYKVGVSDKLLELSKNSTFHDLASQLYTINNHLKSQELRKNNYDIYSDLLFQKAELLSVSPDARVALLLELTTYHHESGYVSEEVISMITAAALVAEYLYHLNRIPPYFKCGNPAKMFCLAAPSAISEIVPKDRVKILPKSTAFCSSKYFCEYGLLYLILTAVDACKRAALYELFQRFHSVLTEICEFRHLWQSMSRYYTTASFAWQVINSTRTAGDRSLGNYYRVQFMDGRVYIYRETKLANIWQIVERLRISTKFISDGKEVEVINSGEELNPETFEPNKYYVHVKAVNPYFTSDERKKRVTVFEQNHNISQFYFDIPISKSAQASIEHCLLKRTIFTIPHPLPYIVKRVEVPIENIQKVLFSPIEFSCQNLQKQIDLIEEACERKDFPALQPLIQGSLLVQVNEGPNKIAEVFLGTGVENEHTNELRNIFRRFIDANARAVQLHSEYAITHPVFSVLQEELDSGLNRLMSSLQPYLT